MTETKTIQSLTEITKLDEIDYVDPKWRWNRSAEKGVESVGQLRDHGGYYFPVTATIRKEEGVSPYSKRINVVINYNGAGCNKTLTKDFEYAKTKEEYKEQYDGDEYLEERLELRKKLIGDDELISDYDSAYRRAVMFIEKAEWYEKMSEMDKMEVEVK